MRRDTLLKAIGLAAGAYPAFLWAERVGLPSGKIKKKQNFFLLFTK